MSQEQSQLSQELPPAAPAAVADVPSTSSQVVQGTPPSSGEETTTPIPGDSSTLSADDDSDDWIPSSQRHYTPATKRLRLDMMAPRKNTPTVSMCCNVNMISAI